LIAVACYQCSNQVQAFHFLLHYAEECNDLAWFIFPTSQAGPLRAGYTGNIVPASPGTGGVADFGAQDRYKSYLSQKL